MAQKQYTVLLRHDEKLRKITKIAMGNDGSIYLFLPYHTSRSAHFFKTTTDFGLSRMALDRSEFIDQAIFDDDDRRVKLSYHASGFVQFSGNGILSGQNPDGTAKGIGLESFPLSSPVKGPALGITFSNIEDFPVVESAKKGDIVLDSGTIFLPSEYDFWTIEFHIFPTLMSRFVKRLPSGVTILPMPHPCGGLIEFQVILPEPTCELQNIIGIEFYALKIGLGSQNEHRFSVSGPVGNVRLSEDGAAVADGIFCSFPQPETFDETVRDLGYSRTMPYLEEREREEEKRQQEERERAEGHPPTASNEHHFNMFGLT